MLNPKVNDLHTADITRGLATRLGASALINVAMDRNRLDCNRLSQIIERAPWLLEMIADRVDAIVARHGRVTVLLIHGWNIIEPRLDFGLGLRNSGGELRPPGSACVSACDDFINGPLAGLADRLHQHGIKPTYGMRYPGGGLQNLLQAFTARHRESPNAALRSISEICDARHCRRGPTRTVGRAQDARRVARAMRRRNRRSLFQESVIHNVGRAGERDKSRAAPGCRQSRNRRCRDGRGARPRRHRILRPCGALRRDGELRRRRRGHGRANHDAVRWPSRGVVHRRRPADAFRERCHSRPALDAARGRHRSCSRSADPP